VRHRHDKMMLTIYQLCHKMGDRTHCVSPSSSGLRVGCGVGLKVGASVVGGAVGDAVSPSARGLLVG